MAITVQLPNGIFDGTTFVKEVELDEMTGVEEDIIADQTRKPGGKGVLAKTSTQRMTEVLSRCTLRVGTLTRPSGATRFTAPEFFEKAWRSASVNDRGFAVIRLRQLSLGDTFTFSDKCPECGKELERVTVDLAGLEVSDIPLQLVTTEKTLKAPSGIEIVWRTLTGADEETVATIVQTKKSDFLSHIIHLRTKLIDGKPSSYEAVRALRSADRQALIKAFDSAEGGIDTDVEIECDKCGHEFKRKLNVGDPSFFFPSAGQ